MFVCRHVASRAGHTLRTVLCCAVQRGVREMESTWPTRCLPCPVRTALRGPWSPLLAAACMGMGSVVYEATGTHAPHAYRHILHSCHVHPPIACVVRSRTMGLLDETSCIWMLFEGFMGCRSVIQGEDVVSSGNRLCGFMSKGEEAHITLKHCKAEDDLTYKEVPLLLSRIHAFLPIRTVVSKLSVCMNLRAVHARLFVPAHSTRRENSEKGRYRSPLQDSTVESVSHCSPVSGELFCDNMFAGGEGVD